MVFVVAAKLVVVAQLMAAMAMTMVVWMVVVMMMMIQKSVCLTKCVCISPWITADSKQHKHFLLLFLCRILASKHSYAVDYSIKTVSSANNDYLFNIGSALALISFVAFNDFSFGFFFSFRVVEIRPPLFGFVQKWLPRVYSDSKHKYWNNKRIYLVCVVFFMLSSKSIKIDFGMNIDCVFFLCFFF